MRFTTTAFRRRCVFLVDPGLFVVRPQAQEPAGTEAEPPPAQEAPRGPGTTAATRPREPIGRRPRLYHEPQAPWGYEQNAKAISEKGFRNAGLIQKLLQLA